MDCFDKKKGVEVNDALKAFDANDSVRAIIITGSEKAFAGNFVVFFSLVFL